MIRTRKRPCPRCNGSGRVTVVDGADLRKVRDDAGLSLRELAGRAKPPLSAMYLCDVEKGRRNASARVLELYGGLA